MSVAYTNAFSRDWACLVSVPVFKNLCTKRKRKYVFQNIIFKPLVHSFLPEYVLVGNTRNQNKY